MTRNKKLIYKMVLCALFSALTFALTFVSVPLPTGAKVHLGNFACVLAGLLCGGVIGGISGSLGMGLNDIAQGYVWTTTLRTFITKFLLGFIVGILFKLLIKRDKTTKITLYALTGLFLAICIFTIVLYANGNPIYSYINEKNKTVKTLVFDPAYNLVSASKGYMVSIGNSKKLFEISILVPIFMGILSALLIGVTIWVIYINLKGKDLSKRRIYTVVATVTAISVLVNTIFEFWVRIILVSITSGFSTAMADAIIKIPSNLTTGVVTLVCVTVVYLPIYLALKNSGFDKYLINNEIEEEKSNEESI